MTYEQSQFLYRLTHLEETAALVNAGIDPDCSNWDEATLDRAAVVLDEAQRQKIERLTVRRNSEVQ